MNDLTSFTFFGIGNFFIASTFFPNGIIPLIETSCPKSSIFELKNTHLFVFS